jgi:predicted DNA-binding protein
MLQYEREVSQWCSSSGAAFLEEVIENWDDLAEHLSLSAEERLRVSDKNGSSQHIAACHIPGLHEYLDERHMLKYEHEVNEWCLSNGAAFLEEIVENWADLMEQLHLSADDGRRVARCSEDDGEQGQPEVRLASGEHAGRERILTWLSSHRPQPQSPSPGAEATSFVWALSIGHLPMIPEAEPLTYSTVS